MMVCISLSDQISSSHYSLIIAHRPVQLTTEGWFIWKQHLYKKNKKYLLSPLSCLSVSASCVYAYTDMLRLRMGNTVVTRSVGEFRTEVHCEVFKFLGQNFNYNCRNFIQLREREWERERERERENKKGGGTWRETALEMALHIVADEAASIHWAEENEGHWAGPWRTWHRSVSFVHFLFDALMWCFFFSPSFFFLSVSVCVYLLAKRLAQYVPWAQLSCGCFKQSTTWHSSS